MAPAILAALPLAVGLALAALPVVLIPIALAAKRPAAVARGFLFGWLLGIGLAGTVVIALADVLVLPSGNVAWFGYAKIVLGLLLVALAVRRWAGRPRSGEDPPVPGWLAGIDAMSAGKSFGLALLLATLNPKNLALVLAGALAIAEATPVPGQQAVALVIFTLVSSIGVGAPVVLTMVMGERADPLLTSVDRWMTRQSTVIVAAVLLVLGILLTVNGFAAL
jgi:hypothetical protein